MAGSAPSSSELIDKLSNLPEHILLHILSFLPTKEAVATSVLSKPWQHLWTLVPAIDIHDHKLSWKVTFEQTVSKVLELNKAPIIRRFRLRSHQCTTSVLDKWLSSATERKVEELDLDFNNFYGGVFPSQHHSFPSKTLVVMKVTMGFNGSSFHLDDLYFPILKILHLKYSRFPSLLGLFSSQFPLLEELVLEECKLHHDINISLPFLRHLEINCAYTYYIGKYSLNIEAPSLEFLLLREFKSGGGFRVENLPNLVEAHIDVFGDDQDEENGESLMNFVNLLCNVSRLELSLNTMQALRNASSHADRILLFHNLVGLCLQLDGSVLSITMIMLSKFVNLQHLVITGCSYDETEYCLAPPAIVPNCLTYHLKTFYFEYFRCSNHEMELIIYILKNSLVLEKARIPFDIQLVWRKGYHSQKILSTTSKGSPKCQLEFDLWLL